MANTVPDGIWYPDEDETIVKLDQMFATQASSIANGIGKRVAKLETFVGCNLGLANPFVSDGAIRKAPYAVQGANAPGSFNQGMTVSGGTVTVPEAGIYTVAFTANFRPTGSGSPARLNTYIYVNGVPQNFSSAYGAGSTLRYTNCNVVAVYNLSKNDQIDVRVATYDNPVELTPDTGSSFCVSLTSRTLT